MAVYLFLIRRFNDNYAVLVADIFTSQRVGFAQLDLICIFLKEIVLPCNVWNNIMQEILLVFLHKNLPTVFYHVPAALSIWVSASCLARSNSVAVKPNFRARSDSATTAFTALSSSPGLANAIEVNASWLPKKLP